MKRFYDLTPHQQDVAVDKAVEVLAKMLVEEGFDFQFHSALSQSHFMEAMVKGSNSGEFGTKSVLEMVIASDEIYEELAPHAELMAEIAWYPSSEEYCIQGVI
jgi:hypothetical protein